MKTPVNPISDDCAFISVLNPATQELIGKVPNMNPADIDEAVSRASAAGTKWAGLDPTDRGKILYAAAGAIRSEQEKFARILTTEQGKPLNESRNEVAGFARVLEYYASISGGLKGDYGKSSLYGHAIVSRQPLGVCGAIIPWNMPALIMGWKSGPALAAGNSLILKPASSAPLTCTALASCMVSAGLPEDVLQIVTGPGEVTGESIATHPDIRAVSFTGSIEAGRRVALLASPLFKRTTLELGGSDPMIVCSDADLTEAAKGAVAGRFYNCGQTCTAIKRLYVDKSIEEPFIKKLMVLMDSLNLGNGLTPGVTMGPVHSHTQRERIIDQIKRTTDGEFGSVRTGGICPGHPAMKDGFFFEPTLLTDLASDAPVCIEEVFGPVLPVIPFDTLNSAIKSANSTRYGLGASVWTHDSRIISRVSQEVRTGIIWINQHLRIPPEVPFGGTKDSGIGRENGRFALDHYLEEKTVLIKP
jgi:acyl-CoA reductase-like NAD-dependent aldehyde dehydrogenase